MNGLAKYAVSQSQGPPRPCSPAAGRDSNLQRGRLLCPGSCSPIRLGKKPCPPLHTRSLPSCFCPPQDSVGSQQIPMPCYGWGELRSSQRCGLANDEMLQPRCRNEGLFLAALRRIPGNQIKLH
ncbi:unnamed protein product [Arctogadus glacialis]